MSYFIQTTSVAWQRMFKVARATGSDPARISHGLHSLWFEWYETGCVEVSLGALKGHFGKDGIEDVVDSLVDFEFLDRLEDGRFRIRGTDRYGRETNKRAEAGRKGGKVTAEKMAREGGRFTKQNGLLGPSQPSNDQANHQANHQAKPAVEPSWASGPHQANHQANDQASQASHQANAIFPPSKPSIERERERDLSSPLRGESEPRAPAPAHPPARMSAHASPANPLHASMAPEVKAAADRFLAALGEHRISGPPAHLTEQALGDLAAQVSASAFIQAVSTVVAIGADWPGWRVRYPDNWLRQEAERARFAASPKAKQASRQLDPREAAKRAALAGVAMPGDWDYQPPGSEVGT